MENLDFSEEEIQEQLAFLGYKNIPKHRLLEFKQDLDELVQHGQWRNVTPTALINTKTQTTTTHSSPPTYIKEKVSASFFEGSREGFFLHAQITNHDRKPLITQENRNHGWQQGCCESYAQHSVAPKLQLPPSAPNRLQVEPDTEDTLGSALSDSYTSSSDLQQRHYIKRKVLRKHKGKSHVCDESVYSEGSDVSSCLEERMAGLDLSTSAQKDFEAESENGTKSSDTDGTSLSAFESYIRGMTRSESDGDVRPKPKSFIRPVLSQQTVKKTDPVAKYFQYKQIWEMFKLPGESDRKALRREIKERLAYQPPPPKPQRVYVPNTYTVPTEKKRLALRWEVRNDLANGLIPQRFNYHL
ncbi:hydrolethalus syndrome protein 1 [Kryptolebias marmoratus]|uniref:HYLS1 centriolar and ciliogenesis associated n=1 Tax=Kryptolebias marmoratus TaxID=37003 RepID=A0A3Q3AL58_KRYMA|nr:hydrolethalus syndrome protein 1 [Kryptolebias marmoratus]XP_037830854.1 hydrolethalus syndrome protein 1 [Kryptolebias marmoratus]XP_037830855.1 hydrolethalus syndrome protein 1 [Kryptolebias marmoratus]